MDAEGLPFIMPAADEKRKAAEISSAAFERARNYSA